MSLDTTSGTTSTKKGNNLSSSNYKSGAEEKVRRLGAVVALALDLGLVPITHRLTTVYNLHVYRMWYINYTCKESTNTYKIK